MKSFLSFLYFNELFSFSKTGPKFNISWPASKGHLKISQSRFEFLASQLASNLKLQETDDDSIKLPKINNNVKETNLKQIVLLKKRKCHYLIFNLIN